jgi:predicted TIM-barrel fold metal-dependent hydrolase
MSPPLPLTRRHVLAWGATAVGLACAKSPAQDVLKDCPWIDAHSHIWSDDLTRYPLADKLTRADLDPPSFTDDDLLAIAKPSGVGRVVLIQHSIYHLFDNSYVLDVARRRPQQFRVVAMLDDTRPDAAAAMPKLLTQGVTGLRISPLIRKEHAEKWLETPGMDKMWSTGAKTRQAMCCLINPQQISDVDKMCQKHPDTPVVVDHFARIGMDGVLRNDDLSSLCRLATHKQVAVKLSAFYALGRKTPPYRDLIPMVKRVFDAFGPERLMWGSDCPYQLQQGNSYAASFQLVSNELDFIIDEERHWLLSKTAEKTFFF